MTTLRNCSGGTTAIRDTNDKKVVIARQKKPKSKNGKWSSGDRNRKK